jgi:hypothetical protein
VWRILEALDHVPVNGHRQGRLMPDLPGELITRPPLMQQERGEAVAQVIRALVREAAASRAALRVLAQDLREARLRAGRPADIAPVIRAAAGGPWSQVAYAQWRKGGASNRTVRGLRMVAARFRRVHDHGARLHVPPPQGEGLLRPEARVCEQRDKQGVTLAQRPIVMPDRARVTARPL